MMTVEAMHVIFNLISFSVVVCLLDKYVGKQGYITYGTLLRNTGVYSFGVIVGNLIF